MSVQLYNNVENILNKNSDKKLSDKTILTYTQRIEFVKIMIGNKNNNIEEIIKNDKKVIKIIEDSNFSVATKKLTFVALYVLSKKLKMSEEIIEEYKKKMEEYKEKNNFSRRENKVSVNNSKNWCHWDELLSVFDMIKPDSFEKMQDKLIVGLYTLVDYTLRLDWANVRVHLSKNAQRKYNWLLWDQKNNKFIFNLNKYKTDSKFGRLNIEITNEKLKNLLNEWFTTYNKNPKWLLTNYRDLKKGLGESSLSRRISNIFEAYINKKVSNQLLRQIRESFNIFDNKKSYDEMDLNQKYEIHKKLLHSFATAHEYSKKD